MICPRVFGMNRQLVFTIIFLGFAANQMELSIVGGQIVMNRGFLPRCRYDESILKNDRLFKDKIERAHVVFTGKIISEIAFKNNSMEFSVSVRRYFKNLLGFPKNIEVRVAKFLKEGEGVKCRQPVRVKYTAIFIGKKSQAVKDVDIVLSLAPLPVTLHNLDRVSSATKGLFSDLIVRMPSSLILVLGLMGFFYLLFSDFIVKMPHSIVLVVCLMGFYYLWYTRGTIRLFADPFDEGRMQFMIYATGILFILIVIISCVLDLIRSRK